MGPLEEWELRRDILEGLACYSLEHVVENILARLTSSDLRQVRLVNRTWHNILERIWDHREYGRLGLCWRSGEPLIEVMQCERDRSVCTVTALAVDERSVAAGLGSSGKIEVWGRRKLVREMVLPGHKEGVYSVDLGQDVVVSGGEDGVVRVWDRRTGEELASLNHHTYIVWSVRLWMDRLVTASYDCQVVYLRISKGVAEVEDVIQGPWEWADALYLEESGQHLVVHNEDTYQLAIWDVKKLNVVTRLAGHSEEVHCIAMRGQLLVSGGADKTVRLWNWRTGACIAVLVGHEGKVWSVGVDRFRVASGGRHGEVRVWDLPPIAGQLLTSNDDIEDANNDGDKDMEENKEPEVFKGSRLLAYHPRSTSVAVIHLDRTCLLTGDGLATVLQWDFWNNKVVIHNNLKNRNDVKDPIFAKERVRVGQS